MLPHRVLPFFDEEAPPSSGPPTMRSARFEVAPVASLPPPSADAPSDGYIPVLERSDVIQAVQRRSVPDEAIELSDEDLEILFDEEALFEECGPDTERMAAPAAFDSEPPPTLRSPAF